jgi:hypothetical protein
MTTYVQYEANGSVAAFTVPFPYLSEAHVKVSVDGIAQILGAQYDVTGPSTVTFRPTFLPEAGAVISVYRETPTDALVAYQNGAVLTAGDLNTATLQALYGLEEVRDKYERLLGGGITRITNGTVVSPSEALDALTQDVLNSSLLTELQSRITDIDINAEAILEQTLRVNALIDNIAELTSGNSSYATLLTNETNSRVTADSALAEDISFIGAKSPDGLSFIFDASTAKVDATTSLADKLNVLQSTLDDNVATVATEITTRASETEALATTLQILGATADAGASFILDTAAVKVSPSLTLADKLTALESTTGTATYRQDTAPASPTAGDIWIDTDDGRKAYRWSGTDWELIDNEDIASTKAAVISEASTRAAADSALASDITTVTTSVGANTAAIEAAATSIDGLEAKYTVKVDVNGYVAGYGLAVNANTGTPTSEFIVLADRFAVVTPGQVKKVPFVIGNVNGLSVVGINGALIVDGTISANSIAANSITAAKIAAGAITADKISANAITADKIVAGAITAAKIGDQAVTSAALADASITSAKIGNLQVKNANIENLTVNGEKIAAGAVTASGLYSKALSSFDGDLIATAVSTWYNFVYSTTVDAKVSLTGIPTTGGSRIIIAVNISARRKGSSSERVSYRVIRNDGVVILPSNIDAIWSTGSDEQNFAWNFYDDAPVAASHTYQLQVLRQPSRNAGLYAHVQLLATLLKK